MRNKSLKKQVSIIIIITVIIGTLLLIVLYSGFLEKIYISTQKGALESVFLKLDEASKDNSLYTTTYYEDYLILCEKENVSSIILRSDGLVLVSTENSNRRITEHLFESLFSGKGELVDSSNNFTIVLLTDEERNGDYLALWGVLSDGNTIFLETAMESVRLIINYVRSFVFIFGIVLLASWIGLTSFSALRSLRLENERLEGELKIMDANEKMRKELISNISHELKTPISLILGYSDGLLDESVSGSREKQEHYAEVIADEADRMDNLISKLLELNELEYGNLHLNIEECDLSKIVKEEVDSLLLLAKNADINIETAFTEPVKIITDAFLARQVIDNYLTNAIKYAKGEKIVRVYSKEDVSGVKLCVFNSGDGIDPEELPKIWDKFYKIDKARTRQINSTGIGLSVVKAAAEGLKCDYGVSNVEGGILFYFVFKGKN